MAVKTGHVFTSAELRRYPTGTQHQYLFTPEKFAYFSDAHPIERTFLKENQNYWRDVVHCNIDQLRSIKAQSERLEKWVFEQKGEISIEQSAYRTELVAKKRKHQLATVIALGRRKTGFGLTNTSDPTAKRLIGFYRALQLVNQSTENSPFKGSILETALGIIQKKVFFEDASESLCGLDNGPILKRIIAKLNCHGNFDNELFRIQVVTQELSEKLALLAKRDSYRMPAYYIGD
jgi:hypothetical protein